MTDNITEIDKNIHKRLSRDKIDYEEFHRQSRDNRRSISTLLAPTRASSRVRARAKGRKSRDIRGFDVISTGEQGQFHKSPSTDTIPFFKSRECAALKRIKADVVNSGATLRHIELRSAASRRIEIQAAVVVCAA